MSAADPVDGRPLVDGRPSPRAPRTVRRRQRELVIVVVVAAGIVAVTLTAHGLLVPAGASTPLLRVVGAVVAVAAGGVLLRTEGPAQATTTLAVVSVAAALTAVATFPASEVTWTPHPPSTAEPEAPADGTAGGLTDVFLDTPGEATDGVPDDVTPIPGESEVSLEDGQVVLTAPDGGRTVLGSAAELRGRQLRRPDGTRVAIGDGALLEVPAPLEPEEPAEPGPGTIDGVLAFLLGCFALLAFAPPVVRFAERADVGLVDRRVEPDTDTDTDAPATARTVEEGLSDVLRAMLTDPDPRTAVIGAYARLLAALAAAGAPRRPEEGPHEHLWRSLGPLGVRRQPVHRLAELFVQARFTPRPVTAGDRDAAIAALADALGDLRLDARDPDARDLAVPDVSAPDVGAGARS